MIEVHTSDQRRFYGQLVLSGILPQYKHLDVRALISRGRSAESFPGF